MSGTLNVPRLSSPQYSNTFALVIPVITPFLILTENDAPLPPAAVTVGAVVYPAPGIKRVTVLIAPLASTEPTWQVACVPPAGGAEIVRAEVNEYPDPPATTSISLLGVPP